MALWQETRPPEARLTSGISTRYMANHLQTITKKRFFETAFPASREMRENVISAA
jgi:hypothetical protein